MSNLTAAEIRSRLDHPVIDADGHTIEFMPALSEYIKREGVSMSSPSWKRTMSGSFGPVDDWYSYSVAERRRRRVGRGPWAGNGAVSTVDVATGLIPRLLYSRLDELGIDVSIVYPSYGLLFMHFDDDDDRRGVCRALNTFNAELFAPYADRLVPVAAIPMHTPAEAIAELEHAHSLGMKAVVMAGFVQRPVDIAAERDRELAQYALWTDCYGMDSQYDYDPVWQKCRELKIAPSFHSGALGWPNRCSISSYVYNHIGMLGESNHAVAKSLFMGGVTRRFPDLNFGFLEGGVSWAVSLFVDLIGHWEKRNGKTLKRLNEGHDWGEFGALFEKWAPEWKHLTPSPRPIRDDDLPLLDEFAACGIESPKDIYELFVPRFYAGCEADDPMTATAFAKGNPMGARINAIFGSDISHWDVPDMTDVLPESWEMVEDGLITEADYRDFMFANPARFYTHVNPDFFKGTVAEGSIGGL